MMTFRRTIWVVCSLSFVAPLFAASIQCKHIPNTSVQQCVSLTASLSKLYGLTNMPYALCAKALCTFNKKTNKARCYCDLFKDKNWTTLSISPYGYEKSKPTLGANKQPLTVQSNFSLANTLSHPHAENITCNFRREMPWANCFGARCQVVNAKTAICMCDVVESKTFAISGPGGNRKCITKPGQIWSAIYVKDAQANGDFVNGLYAKLYPDSPVVKAHQ